MGRLDDPGKTDLMRFNEDDLFYASISPTSLLFLIAYVHAVNLVCEIPREEWE